MRVGTNPQKAKRIPKSDFFHQVILPVYIPNEEGYFRDAFQILKICLCSLFKSSHPRTFITIVDNGSCAKVRDYLTELFCDGSIHELMHTGNIGKVNAIYKGIIGHEFALVTVSDADVLYINGWQQAVYELFNAMPKVGAVCTTPLSRRNKYHTSNLLFEKFFSKDLSFTPVKDAHSMLEFARSIGDERLLRETHLKKYLTITEGGKRAVIGAGHFTCTYKADIFADSQFRFSDSCIGGEALGKYLDRPVIMKGYWRVSTEENFTWHMGNVYESWMDEKLAAVELQEIIAMPSVKTGKCSRLNWVVKGILFPKLLYSHSFWKKFQQFKGLTPVEASDY
ncbi:MAG: glycosyltransferase family 2 protein [Flavobacterium sp.]|nr:MAG: glycosyltransferase family 2 protein [Flavobacterium sp.]